MKEISSPQEKIDVLEAYLITILRKVNSIDTIHYGFLKTALKEPIEYPPQRFIKWFPYMYDELHDGGPFRGAILNGEGAAYYNIKIHIKHLIDELNGTFVQENGNLVL